MRKLTKLMIRPRPIPESSNAQGRDKTAVPTIVFHTLNMTTNELDFP